MWIRPRNYSTACTPRAIVLCSVGSLTFNPSHFRTRRRVHGNSAPRPWIRHVRAWPPTTHPRHRCGGCRRAEVHSGCLRAAAGPGRPRHTRATSAEGAGGTAGPGRASSRRAEPQARGADGERAGGPDGTRNTSDAATTSVSEGGGRAWPLTTHPRHQCEGCQRDRRAVWRVPAEP